MKKITPAPTILILGIGLLFFLRVFTSDNPSKLTKLILEAGILVFTLGFCVAINAGSLPNAIRKIIGLLFTLLGMGLFIIIATGIINGLKTANPNGNVAQGIIAAIFVFSIPILLSLALGLGLIFYKKGNTEKK